MARVLACRSCGSAPLTPILSLGHTPLANAFLTAQDLERPEATYPLDVAFCTFCSLVQITEEVPPDQLFRDYIYFSSYSETMLEHVSRLAQDLIASRSLGPSSLVIELASNDGYLLKNYLEAGIPALGIEPARNIARHARARGVPTREEFFSADLAVVLRAEGLFADLIHAHNVLAHVPDLNGFVSGIRILLKPAGLAVIEVPYVRDMLDGCEFDTIYHEHLCYFSLGALERCCGRNGLTIVDVARVPVHGGSLQLHVAHADQGEPSSRVRALREDEEGWEASAAAPYLAFAETVERVRHELREMLSQAKSQGRRIAGYGASAKGSTLLNYCDIGPETLDFIVDRSAAKQNRFTPGSHLPVSEPNRLLQEMPDYTLLLAWNIADEILKQEQGYRDRGGRFIIPLPRPKVV